MRLGTTQWSIGRYCTQLATSHAQPPHLCFLPAFPSQKAGVTTVTLLCTPPPGQPVVKMVSSVGMRHGSHVGQGPHEYVAVGVKGQQSVAHETVVLLTLRYKGQIWSEEGASHWI